MTNAFLARFDALARQSFARAGVADAATFKLTPASDPVACTVYVDRGMQDVGDQAVTKNALVTIKAFRDQIQEPRIRQSVFTVGSETFTVDALADNSDESMIVCIVRPA